MVGKEMQTSDEAEERRHALISRALFYVELGQVARAAAADRGERGDLKGGCLRANRGSDLQHAMLVEI